MRKDSRRSSRISRCVAVGAVVLGSGCGPQGGVFCDDGKTPSCYEVDFSKSQIAILWPNSEKRLDLPLTKTGEGTYSFPNPLGEDRGAVVVRVVDDKTLSVKNERDEGEPMIHKRRE